MKYTLPILIVLGLFLFSPLTQVLAKTSSDSLNTPNLKDEYYKKKIIGEWSEGGYPYGIAAFKEGGVYLAWIWETPQKNNLIVTMKGKWWIENGRLYNTISEMIPPMDMNIDGIVIDEIVDITDTVMTLIDDQGKQYTNI